MKIMKKLTNVDLKVILEGIMNCGEQTKQPFRSKMMRNAADIKAELKELQDSFVTPDGWEEFAAKEQAIIKEYSTGNENGQPVFGANYSKVVNKMAELELANTKLVAQYKKAVEDFNVNVLDAPAELELRTIKELDLPKELTLNQCLGIELLITYKD